jgi:SAM-dependent methyltransferase
MSLQKKWEEQASQWIAWARADGHDAYWRFHREQFFRLVPPPGRLTVDIGCGEGRVARDLKRLGHNVIAIDGSPSLVAAARESDPVMDVRLADATALPLEDVCADLAIAFMSPQDIDAMSAAIREIGRVLEPGGRFCMAIVHPLNSAGRFASNDADAPFIIQSSYLDEFTFADTVERAGLPMTFHSRHRPIETYFLALEQAGFLVEALREPPIPDSALDSDRGRRWQRVPLFLHLRARRV